MPRKAFVNKDDCIGCTICSDTCPEIFNVKEDPEYKNDFKSFTNDDFDQEPIANKIQEAIDSCPVHCITWNGKKV